MGLAQQFTNLGEDMIASYNERVNFVGKNIVDTRKLLAGFRKEHNAMARKLLADLPEAWDKMQSEFRRENQQAHRAWQQVARAMASKRHNFNAALTKAKQSAARTH